MVPARLGPKSFLDALAVACVVLLLGPSLLTLTLTVPEEGVQIILYVSIAIAMTLVSSGMLASRLRLYLVGSGLVTVLSVVMLAIDGGFDVLALQAVFLCCLLASMLGGRVVQIRGAFDRDERLWPDGDDLIVRGMVRMTVDALLWTGGVFLISLALIALSIVLSLGRAPLLLAVILTLVALISLFIALRKSVRSER
jgi:hypothetical protein